MQAFKLQIKLFAAENGAHDVERSAAGGRRAHDVERYVPVFHRWIRDNVLGELVIDVVDYRHVADGPSVVLIGHAVDYALDHGGGRLGLLHVRKRDPLPEAERLGDALRRALRAGVLLEREPGLQAPLQFRSDQLLIRIADRLAAPNTKETFERLEPELRAGLERVFPGTAFTLRQVGTPRDLFGVEVEAKNAPPLATLLERLGPAN